MSSAAAAATGDGVDAIDTPALVVDLDAMERNLATMAAFARSQGMRLRPHAKMHKCAAIAQLQIAAGAVGVCVQKTSEAEALADAGIDDIYVSNEVIAPEKLARVAALARRIRLAVAVDSAEGVDRLAAALREASAGVDVFVEIDVGQGRCGAPPAAAGALAHRVVSHAPPEGGLRFAGLQAYHGGAQHLRGAAEREAASRHAAALARAAQASITASGIACPLVTGGGTGTFAFDAASGVWGELQCGSYLFMDRDYADNAPDPHGPRFEHALFVKSRVMSRGASHAVVDAGHKSHAIDSGLPAVHGRPLTYSSGGDEHGILRPAREGAESTLPALGETVWLIPGHCDPTVNLHDHLVAVRGGLDAGIVETVWPIDARGAVR
jgi:D-serine deaminase-like pyridoxal phosphate-dependent protein